MSVAILHSWLDRLRLHSAEVSRLAIGSTGSGKSVGELVELVRLAERRTHAVVLLDGHGPLALEAVGHWGFRGHESRLIYEPLHVTDRVLSWPMLTSSTVTDPRQRRLENAEIRNELVECFLVQRNLTTVNDRPYTKEWLEAAIDLCLAQPQAEPLPSLLHAFRIKTADYERLLCESENEEVTKKFRDLEKLRRQNAVQYETIAGASRRLLELVCNSEIVRLRARPSSFDWLVALQERKLIIFDGGSVRTRELKRTLFLLVTMHIIHAIRRQFSQTQRPLPVVLVLEEAGALGLVTPFVLNALRELRKAGLAIHILTQSSQDFGDLAIFESILSNTPWVGWYQVLSPADQELGAKVLTNASFNAYSVHFTRTRWVRRPEHENLLLPVTDPYFQNPELQLQLFRTRLATLRVGERLVRTRKAVWCERVRMLRPPNVPGGFETTTRNLIARIRQQPLYLPPPPSNPAPEQVLPDAAQRLLAEGDSIEDSTP